MLEISQVSKTFFPNTVNERRALQGIDLHLAEEIGSASCRERVLQVV